MIPLHDIPKEELPRARLYGRNGAIYLDNNVIGTTTTITHNINYDYTDYSIAMERLNQQILRWSDNNGWTWTINNGL